MRLHALVSDLETARAAAGGATVLQLRLKGAPTSDVVELGRAIQGLGPELIVHDDLEPALELGCGVHLGQGDPGVERACEAAVAEFAGATYVGAGPIWETPSKTDVGDPIGLDGLRDVCVSVSIPVVASGGIDAANAAACIRAVAEIEALRAAIDAAV